MKNSLPSSTSVLQITPIVPSAGDTCGVDVDECESAPCQHGSECQDLLNAYVCQCLPGYRGTNCEVDINECQEGNLQCQNGGSCIDKVTNAPVYKEHPQLWISVGGKTWPKTVLKLTTMC